MKVPAVFRRISSASIFRKQLIVIWASLFCWMAFSGFTAAETNQSIQNDEVNPHAAFFSLHLSKPDVDTSVAKFCERLGAPISQSTFNELSGYEIRAFENEERSFVEKIGPIDVGKRTRSSRFMKDGSRSAHHVSFLNSKLCLEGPDKGEENCNYVFECQSKKGTFVSFGENERPLLKLTKPPKAIKAASDNDWVKFARGSAFLSIPSDELQNRGSNPVNARASCTIGAGHPEIDSAELFAWRGSNCQAGFAVGAGEVLVLNRDGSISSVPLGPDLGLETKKGKLRWSFPDFSFDPLHVECYSKTRGIPQTSEDVYSVEMILSVPSSIQLGEKLIYEKIFAEARSIANKICAPRRSARIKLTINRSNRQPFVLAASGNKSGVPRPLESRHAVLKIEEDRDVSAANKAYPIFGNFIRKTSEAQRREKIERQLSGSTPISHIANAYREFPLETVVSLANTATIKLPWFAPEFSNDVFTISWRSVSTDPVDEYFASKSSTTSWNTLRGRIPSPSKKQASIRITCKIPREDALEFSPNRWVTSSATLQSYSTSNTQIALDCVED